jgi:hypothetical protein
MLSGRRCESNEIVPKIGFGHLLVGDKKKIEIRHVPSWDLGDIQIRKKNPDPGKL